MSHTYYLPTTNLHQDNFLGIYKIGNQYFASLFRIRRMFSLLVSHIAPVPFALHDDIQKSNPLHQFFKKGKIQQILRCALESFREIQKTYVTSWGQQPQLTGKCTKRRGMKIFSKFNCVLKLHIAGSFKRESSSKCFVIGQALLFASRHKSNLFQDRL